MQKNFEKEQDLNDLTLSSADLPVNPSQVQDMARVLVTNVICGLSSSESSAIFDPNGSLLKMSKGWLTNDTFLTTQKSYGGLPLWGITSGGLLSALKLPATHRKIESESSQSDTVMTQNWATPDTQGTRGGSVLRTKAVDSLKRGLKSAISLHHDAHLWERSHQAQDWVELASSLEYKDFTPEALSKLGELISKNWQAHLNGEKSSENDQSLHPKSKWLNWRFMQWLQGFGHTWLDRPWLKRATKIKMLGNAVIPFHPLPFFVAIKEAHEQIGKAGIADNSGALHDSDDANTILRPHYCAE